MRHEARRTRETGTRDSGARFARHFDFFLLSRIAEAGHYAEMKRQSKEIKIIRGKRESPLSDLGLRELSFFPGETWHGFFRDPARPICFVPSLLV